MIERGPAYFDLVRQLAASARAASLFVGRSVVRPAGLPVPVEPPVPMEGPVPVEGATGEPDSLEQVAAEVAECRLCRLCETRNRVVPGEGSPRARLMFVGEAPGFDEDRQGRPFVGRAGQLLTRMIEAGMGLRRDEVFIANVLKCRPPDNRDPMVDEAERCRPYLLRQIELIDPEVICTLGRHALKALTGYLGGIGKVRGRPMEFRGRVVIPTFHPAYLLRNENAKRDAWEDLKTVLRRLELPIPDVRRR